MITVPVRVSAIVLSLNSRRFIDVCVRSLAEACSASKKPDELWVVDNGSTDGTVEVLRRLEREFHGFLRVIYLEQNLGTTISRNLALSRVSGRYIVIADSDTKVSVGSLEQLIARVDADVGVGIVAPKLEFPDGQFQLSTDVFPTLPHKLKRWMALRFMERRVAFDFNEARTVDYAISAFWLMRRDVVERVGGFDERIFYAPEDVDYCLRVWSAGYTVLYDPSVRVIHDAREISRGLPLSSFSWSHLRGLLYLFRKHRYSLGRRRLYRRLHQARDSF